MVEAATQGNPLNYVIEHFEPEVSKWTLSEYMHMILILSDLYADPITQAPNKLIVTNFPFVSKLKLGTLDEDEYGSKKHTEQFMACNENMGKKALVSKYPLLDLTTKEKLEGIISSEALDDDSVEIAKIFQTRMVAINRGESNICFMDMRAEKVLAPEDR